MTSIHFTDADKDRIERDWSAWWAGELERPLVVIESKDGDLSALPDAPAYCMRLNEDGSIRHPLNVYLQSLRAVIARIKQRSPHAKLIFALTTQVDQDRQKTSNYGRVARKNGDIPRYNPPARKLAEEAGCRIDDLYSVAMAAGKDELIGPDGVHFIAKGYAILGRAVAQSVLRPLAMPETKH